MNFFLLCCKLLRGRHTGENIPLEYETIIDIVTKLFKVITDNASNMIKVFCPTIHELLLMMRKNLKKQMSIQVAVRIMIPTKTIVA